MTNEEMEKRWPVIPPYKATFIRIYGFGNSKLIEISQDTIDEIIEYLQAAKESMNS